MEREAEEEELIRWISERNREKKLWTEKQKNN